MTHENEVHKLPANESASTVPGLPSHGTRRKVFLLLAVCAVIALICVGTVPRLFLSHELRSQAHEQAATSANVFVTPAQASPPFVSVQLSGTMSPITEAPILARADGYLKRRLVDIGDLVRAGQVIGVIETPELDQQVQQAKALYEQSQSTLAQSSAALEQARANAGIAGITAERWAALVKRGAVSRQANDNYQFAYSAQVAAVSVATASVAAATNSVGANAANLDHYRELQSFEIVRAPFAGVITQRNVDEGALVTATDTLLFRVAKTDTLRTFIDVPQINAPSIHVGDAADLTFVQFPGHTFHGTITRTSGSLDLNTRTLLTEVDLDNRDGKLLPGMYATVTFSLPRTVSSILIPSEALVFRAAGTTVAVVDDQHTVRFRKVVVGHDYGPQIEIVSGLGVGESVIVNPNDTTAEGAKVNPVSLKQASGSLAAASTTSSGNSRVEVPPARGMAVNH
ncbi:RND family efflux transporter, MFP subunit [Bryocella elongata]|uniref:RND family efflux transporter, MFP subunit n=1 Tax=Bryocella elongata TaxID=863522 RepID=A0A1H5T5S4_9BACT|nr:efflux RND transporter periplasmic adaptor subunit [Bryocella elongata]SEF57347.1 RND family efflux transporter, MFP subunit [Bryocella elongata]